MKQILKKNYIMLIAVIFSTLASQANATILAGDALRIEWLFPDTGSIFSSWDVIVGSGVEVVDAAGYGAIDIDVDGGMPNILFDFTSSAGFGFASFNGFRISDYTGTVDDFTNISINSITNMFGFDLSRVSFTADTIDMNFQGLGVNADTFVGLDVDGVSVIAPAPFVLLSLGLVGIGAATKRRNRKH